MKQRELEFLNQQPAAKVKTLQIQNSVNTLTWQCTLNVALSVTG